jgi:filamentous hemagglutinin
MKNLPIEESALAHAALGCAASAAEGTGCAGGAIGAASSALLTPFIGQAVVGSGAATTAQTAVITALAALLERNRREDWACQKFRV